MISYKFTSFEEVVKYAAPKGESKLQIEGRKTETETKSDRARGREKERERGRRERER